MERAPRPLQRRQQPATAASAPGQQQQQQPAAGDGAAQLPPRAAELVRNLGLQRHPEGGWYAEVFRSPTTVPTPRGQRSALTTIDFLLADGEFSAWHRVRSDEVWHLLEGGPLRLWLLNPALDVLTQAELNDSRRQHVVPADWWQAAEPLSAFAHAGATVAPGFDFADFSFGRDDAAVLAALSPALLRLL